MDKAKLLAWIAAQEAESQQLHDEAEAARAASEFQDIDSLEQSEYNAGALRTLQDLRNFLEQES